MNQVILAFRWYLVVQLFGLAVLPLCLRLFRHLPDRGYGVSKPLGLLLAGWAFWLLNIFGWLHNTAGGILVALVLVAIAGIALHLTNQQTNQLSWHTILLTEAVFALTFIVGCLVRAHMPRIQTAGGEKWMEIAFLRAILRSDTFPPNDPWLSGFAISYYYFGYVIVAMLTRLAAVPPSIAFNLGIATLFALTCTGAFSLVYNLIRNQVLSEKPGFSTILGGLLGPLLVAVMGNLEGLLESLHARGIGAASFWQWLDIRALDAAPPAFADGSWVPRAFSGGGRPPAYCRTIPPRGRNNTSLMNSPPLALSWATCTPTFWRCPLSSSPSPWLSISTCERQMVNHISRLTFHFGNSSSTPSASAAWAFSTPGIFPSTSLSSPPPTPWLISAILIMSLRGAFLATKQSPPIAWRLLRPGKNVRGSQ